LAFQFDGRQAFSEKSITIIEILDCTFLPV